MASLSRNLFENWEVFPGVRRVCAKLTLNMVCIILLSSFFERFCKQAYCLNSCLWTSSPLFRTRFFFFCAIKYYAFFNSLVPLLFCTRQCLGGHEGSISRSQVYAYATERGVIVERHHNFHFRWRLRLTSEVWLKS